jgi:alpha-aminoadipic semialdehyde synthase
VYLCHVTAEDYIIRNNGGKFQKDRYKSNPEEFKSIFHLKIAPYARFIFNGIYWSEKYPRLLTIDQAHKMAVQNRRKLLVYIMFIQDYSGCQL